MSKYKMVPLSENVEEMFIGPFGSSLKNDCFVPFEKSYCMVYEQKHAIQKTMQVDTRYVDENKYNELKRFSIQGGDIIVSCRGTIGETFIVPDDAPLGIMHPSIMKIRLKPDVYNIDYFNLLLITRLKKHEAEANGSGVKMAISASALGKELFPVPPLETQKQIAANLDKATRMIELCNALLEKLDLLVKARFVEMFGDPVSNSKGWNKVPLGECLISIENGKSFVCSNENRVDDNPAILKLSAVTYGIYLPNENKALLDDSLFDEKSEVKECDLLFTRKNTPELVGMSAYVYNTPPKLMMPDLIFRLNTKSTCNKIYLWKLINHDLFRSCIQSISNGSAKSMSNISKERLSNLFIPLPPLELQEQFAAFVAQTDKSKAAVKALLQKAETLKKALMQAYFG